LQDLKEKMRPVTEAIGAGALYHTTTGAPPLTKVRGGAPVVRHNGDFYE
jgi:hypothetical protein